MKKRNKIASIVLFLAALAVGFDAQPSWCGWSYLYPPYNMSQCTITLPYSPTGLVVLPDHRVLVATAGGLYYYTSFPSDPTQCPGPGDGPFVLNPSFYLSLTMGLDGKVYALLYHGTTDLVTVNVYNGSFLVVPGGLGINGYGMALDPLTGDLYMSGVGINPGKILRYCASCPQKVTTFADVPGVIFDGLAWSCDGRFLFVGSPEINDPTNSKNNQVYRFTRPPSPTYVIATLPGTIADHWGPDGIAVGAAGTAFAGFVFSNNNDGSVTQFTTAPFGSPLTIADQVPFVDRGDFAFVDAQGAMVAIQGNHLQRLSSLPTGSFAGGQWVVPGSTLCSDLGCGAKAATTQQIDQDSPCLSGLDANLVLTLSQSACGSCESCATLNQARGTLLALLNSLDPPRRCLDGLKLTLESLYLSCPCNCPASCVPPCQETKLSGGGTCIAQIKFPLGFDLESYDPILQAFMRKVSSP
jgi:hypothetical protein